MRPSLHLIQALALALSAGLLAGCHPPNYPTSTDPGSSVEDPVTPVPPGDPGTPPGDPNPPTDPGNPGDPTTPPGDPTDPTDPTAPPATLPPEIHCAPQSRPAAGASVASSCTSHTTGAGA